MATQRYDGQPLAVGQWVNLDTMLRIGFAGRPARVLEVKPKSVIVEEAHRIKRTGEVDAAPLSSRRLTSITFVSDTMEEAEAVLDASWAFTDAELEIERGLKKLAGLRRVAAIEAALKQEQK
jgi:uncharacterized protein YlxP (DUF503 family)